MRTPCLRRTSIHLAAMALTLTVAATGAAQSPAPAPAPASAAPAAPSAPANAARRTADASLVRALQDHEWTLRAATDAAGKPVDGLLVAGRPFVLHFDGPALSVRGGCNTLSARWRLSPQNALTVSRAASTQMACEAALMNADAAMAKALAKPLQARVESGVTPLLQLTTAAKQTLSFEGRRTLTSQHGAPTRVFLEVAAQRVPCTPALQPPTTCLQVREVIFDDKGLRVGSPGPWQPFYSEIAGYTHVPGTSNVLRINRYKRQQPPADASAYVYELDLVVESRTETK
jgi:heat shock protein HslJ